MLSRNTSKAEHGNYIIRRKNSMKYKAILRDAIIFTDDYADDEMNALVHIFYTSLYPFGVPDPPAP